MRKVAIIVVVVLLFSPSIGSMDLPPRVSIIQLIANPEKYDEKTVTLIGFMTIAFESDLLYLNYEDYQHAILPNALWFERNPQIMANSEKLDMNYVEIVGTFTTNPIGFGLARPGVGGIKMIWSSVLQSELKHPVAEKFAKARNKH